jgi:hypothetical protein
MSVNEEQAKIVKLIFDLYINKGYGCTKIARLLNESNTPSPVKNVWSFYTVNRVIKNPKYAGYIEYDGMIYEGKHESIIDKETHNLVKQYLKDRTWKREYRGINFERFTMLGLLKCGYCGKVMRAHNYTKLHHGYVCNNSMHCDKPSRCTHRETYRTDRLDIKIENEIKQYIITDSIEVTRESNLNGFMLTRKSKLESKLYRLKEGYLNGVFDIDEFKKTEKEIKKELTEISFEPIKKVNLNNSWERYAAASKPTEKRNILKEYIESIEVTKEGITMNWL